MHILPVFSEWYNALFFKLPENSVILFYKLSINHVMCCSTSCQGTLSHVVLFFQGIVPHVKLKSYLLT